MVMFSAAVPRSFPDGMGVMAWEPWLSVAAFLILVLQIPAVLILLTRLLQGPTRRPPLRPQSVNSTHVGKVSIVVPTLNEADRLQPCLDGLTRQGYEVREILVVDSRSQDGTQALVKRSALQDPRIRLLEDDPLPPGWVGRPWALHTGFLRSSPDSEWILGIDADTQPTPQLAATLLRVAEEEHFDLITLSPRFILKFPGEWWLQPALLMTLVYRFGPAGGSNPPDRVMANGQCCFCRRSLLVEMDGYSGAAQSFCDDVTLVRQAAQRGAKVGFLDGANLLKVRMYEGLKETWQEWGRSLDLKDATTRTQLWGDLALLKLVQGAPLLWLMIFGLGYLLGSQTLPVTIALGLNLFLVVFRFALQAAIRSSYDFETPSQGQWLFWLAPLADPLAVARIFLSASQTPRQWRGRTYS
jgi:dolichol-phosphate mannosyltransferase